MARCRRIGYRFALPCALLATTALSGCGIHIETIAQSPVLTNTHAVELGPSPTASRIFAPCAPGAAEPLENVATAITELLVGKDQYRTSCAPNPAANAPLVGVIERAARVMTRQPVVAGGTPSPQGPAMLVTDELVGAVLTGTGEYWYQPFTGPA